jgi:hypothetical protein
MLVKFKKPKMGVLYNLLISTRLLWSAFLTSSTTIDAPLCHSYVSSGGDGSDPQRSTWRERMNWRASASKETRVMRGTPSHFAIYRRCKFGGWRVALYREKREKEREREGDDTRV